MALNDLVPMQPVASLAVAIAFYEKLGFAVLERREDWGWAMLACGDRRLMLDTSINVAGGAPRRAVLYLYPEDVNAFHAQAQERGLALPPLEETFYGMREFRIDDPDGNRLWIGQRVDEAAAPG